MPVVDQILDLAGKTAQIQNEQMMTRLHAVQFDTAQQAAQASINSRLIARAYEQSKTADAAQSGPGTTPQQGGPAGTQSAPADGSLEQNPQLTAIQAMVDRASKDYSYHSGMASALRSNGGDLKLAEKYDDNARQARQDMNAGQLRLLAQRKEMLTEVGGLAGTADENNFPQIRARMDYLMPGWDKGQDVDFSPYNGGQVTWGPRTQKVLGTIANASLTRNQQLEDVHRAMTESNTADHNAALQDEYDSRDRARRARERAAQDNIDLKEESAQDKRDAAATKAGAPAKATKPAAAKEPSVSEVKDLATNFAEDESDLGKLPEADRRVAARDYLRYRNQALAANPTMDPQQAESEAMAAVKSRIKPGADGEKTWWNYLPFTSGPAKGAPKYSKSGGTAPTPPTPAVIPDALPMPTSKDALVQGKVYNTKRGPAKWNGAAFEAM